MYEKAPGGKVSATVTKTTKAPWPSCGRWVNPNPSPERVVDLGVHALGEAEAEEDV